MYSASKMEHALQEVQPPRCRVAAGLRPKNPLHTLQQPRSSSMLVPHARSAAHMEDQDAQLEQRPVLVDQPGGLAVHGLGVDEGHAAEQAAVAGPRQVRQRALAPPQVVYGPGAARRVDNCTAAGWLKHFAGCARSASGFRCSPQAGALLVHHRSDAKMRGVKWMSCPCCLLEASSSWQAPSQQK